MPERRWAGQEGMPPNCWRKTDARVAASRMFTGPPVVDDAGVSAAVLIVDDNARFRVRARRWLEAEGYTVVGEAADGASALRAVRRQRPEVVLLDVRLPDMSGLSVAERITREPDSPAVVLTSTEDAADLGDRVERSGANGFVPKSELCGEALKALLA